MKVRTHLLWFVLSAATFLAAFVLTVMITSVNGRVPFGAKGLDPLGSGNPSQEKVQLLAVYLGPPEAIAERPPSATPGVVTFFDEPTTDDSIDINYDESANHATARLTIWLPATVWRPGAVDAKILINNLVAPKACEYQKAAFAEVVEYGPPPMPPYEGSTVDGPLAYGSALHVFTLVKPKTSAVVVCFVKPVSDRETFVRHRLRMAYLTFVNMSVDAWDLRQTQELDQFRRATGITFRRAVRSLVVNFGGIAGGEQFFFEGGRRERGNVRAEYTRTLDFGSSVSVSWTDIYREELRDIILIAIGTLVAVGVTTLIEGVRPFIESADNRKRR
jgi:hypothetical protein